MAHDAPGHWDRYKTEMANWREKHDDYALRLHTIYDALGMSDKAADVPRMLGKYKGREEALIAQVEQK